GRGSGDERPCRHERQSLQGKSRPLEVKAPRMVRIVAPGQPGAPEVTRAVDEFERLLGGVRAAKLLRPRQRAEALLALHHRVPAVDAVALDAHANVRQEPEAGPAGADLVARQQLVVALERGQLAAGRLRPGAVWC